MLQHPKGVAIELGAASALRGGTRFEGGTSAHAPSAHSLPAARHYARPRLGSTAALVVQELSICGPKLFARGRTTKIAGRGQLGYMQEAAGVQKNKGAS